ncbi:MAG: polysaccharide deacetylase family protein [Gammaproteobacteria bacterium]
MKISLALLVALLWLSAACAEDHAVVLMYHHVSEDTPASTSVTPAIFERHLEYLEDHGFTVMPLSSILEAVVARRPLPPNAVAITFDDAYRSVYTEAFPRLEKRGWPFTIFVNTMAVDRGYSSSLDWEQIRELARAGAEIGNHSHTHDHLVRLRDGESTDEWRHRVTRDIESAALRIEAETGTGSKLFAYPYGEYSAELEDILRKLGYYGIAQQSGAVGYLTDLLAVPRFPLAHGYDDMQRFATSVNARPLPVRELVATSSNRRLDEIERLRMILDSGDFRSGQLACYSAAGKALPISVDEGEEIKIVVDVDGTGRPGRNKVNCTAPATGEPGTYFWYSYQWLQRNPDGSWYKG